MSCDGYLAVDDARLGRREVHSNPEELPEGAAGAWEGATGGNGGAGRQEKLAQREGSEIRSLDAGNDRWQQGAHQSAVESALGLCSHSISAAFVQCRV